MNTSLAVGDTIADGKYVLEKELGEGGLAVVYKVRHAQLDTPFAIKILKVTLPSLQERLIVEGQLQAQLQHPNVVKVTDVIKVDGFPALVMEFIDGIALDDYLNESPPSRRDAEDMFLQILDAVEEAHDRGIIHRDLKPANVMMQRTRSKFIPKVCDFGLGKNLAKEGQTRTGQQMGTPAYMAPEQIRSTKDVDQRADIFSLGAILYELLTGHRAFKGSNTLDLLNAVASQPHATPRLYIQDLEERYVQAIDGALTKNAQFRIPDCATFRRVLLGEESWASERASSSGADGGSDTLMSLGLDLMGDDGNTAMNLGADGSTSASLPPNNSLVSERRVHQIQPEAPTPQAPPSSDTLNNFEAMAPTAAPVSNEPPKKSNTGIIALVGVALLIAGGVGFSMNTSDPAPTTTTQTASPIGEKAPAKPEPTEVASTPKSDNDDASTKDLKSVTNPVEPAPPQKKSTTSPPKKQTNTETTVETKPPLPPKTTTTAPKATTTPVVKKSVKEPAKPVEPAENATVAASEKGIVKLIDKAGNKVAGHLERNNQRFNIGSVAAGTYSIVLECESGEINVGEFRIKSGQKHTFQCQCGFQMCSEK